MIKGLGILLVVLALVATAAGCGSGGSSSTESSASTGGGLATKPTEHAPAASKTEYISRANKVCDGSWEGIRGQFASRYHSVTHGIPFAEATENIFLPSMQFWFDDIDYIGAPEGEESEVEAMLQALQDAVYAGEEQKVKSPKQLSSIFADYNQLASQYGIDHCLVEESSFQS